MSDLTEADRESLTAALASSDDGCWDYQPCCWSSFEALVPATERIVAAHTAPLREEVAERAAERDFARQQRDRLSDRAEKAERERDAYRKAKQENDERFQLEAAEQRDRADRLERTLADLRAGIKELADEQFCPLCDVRPDLLRLIGGDSR